MGTKNKERRAAKARRRAKERATRANGWRGAGSFEPLFTPGEHVRGLLERAAAASHRGDDAYVEEGVAELVGLDMGLISRESEGVLLSTVVRLWDSGWQPIEVVRHARRADARSGRLVATVVAADNARRAPSTLHPQWAEQLEALALPVVNEAIGWLAAFAVREALDRSALVSTVVSALAVLGGLGPLPTVVPPPGSDTRGARSDPIVAVDDPVLVRVRALLAQAESTTFEAEAEAFTAKAQELMARHAIDSALLWARSERDERPITIRLPIDDPYADIKSLLLQRVACHSRCKAVYHPSYGLASVVGFASDVAAADTLYTSLLVQSHTALQAEAMRALPGERTRSRSFRSSFLMSFTQRIDERLAEINAFVESSATRDHGASLLPALAARDGVVDEAVTEMFGALQCDVVRGGTDAVGWVRGRMAADQARLNVDDLDAPAFALGR